MQYFPHETFLLFNTKFLYTHIKKEMMIVSKSACFAIQKFKKNTTHTNHTWYISVQQPGYDFDQPIGFHQCK